MGEASKMISGMAMVSFLTWLKTEAIPQKKRKKKRLFLNNCNAIKMYKTFIKLTYSF